MASAETEVARVASGGRLGAVATRAAAAMAKEAGCSARIRSLCNLCQARSGTAVIAGAVDGEAQIADACVGANAARYVRCGWCMRRYSHAQTGSRGHVARCSWRVQYALHNAAPDDCSAARVSICVPGHPRPAGWCGLSAPTAASRPAAGDRPIATHVQHADFMPTRDRQQRQRGVTDHALHVESKGASSRKSFLRHGRAARRVEASSQFGHDLEVF